MAMPSRRPVVTLVFVAIVVLTRVAQLAIPAWYEALARHAGGPWWRALTALFAYDDGWVQLLSIALGALAIGTIGEGRFGSLPWAAILFVCGLAGQVCGLFWQPEGAGSSVAVAGLLGALMAWIAWPDTPVPPPARFGPIVVLALAVWLTATRDLHGPPILLGAALGALFLAFGRRASQPHQPHGG